LPKNSSSQTATASDVYAGSGVGNGGNPLIPVRRPVDGRGWRPDRRPMKPPVKNAPVVGIVRLPNGEHLPLPAYETAGAAGMDLRAAVPEDRPLLILPGKRALVPTGLVLEIPEGYEAQVRPRSGLAFKHGITCLNTPGTIDSDYRGEVSVLLINLGDEDFAVIRGMRIAQIVFCAVSRMAAEERSLAGTTARGNGGFGSTGTA
jgi:dUTP pyrophosphatase